MNIGKIAILGLRDLIDADPDNLYCTIREVQYGIAYRLEVSKNGRKRHVISVDDNYEKVIVVLPGLYGGGDRWEYLLADPKCFDEILARIKS